MLFPLLRESEHETIQNGHNFKQEKKIQADFCFGQCKTLKLIFKKKKQKNILFKIKRKKRVNVSHNSHQHIMRSKPLNKQTIVKSD